MYDDGELNTIEDLQYLVNLAAATERKMDRLTILGKAERLIRVIIDKESKL